MNKKAIIFTVAVSVEHDSENGWLKSVRAIRKTLKEVIGNIPEMKVLKIDSKEG